MSADIKYYIGVDGGGTKCQARLKSADGQTLAETVAGPANIRLGLPLIWQNLRQAIDAALALANLKKSVLDITSIGFGLAGITADTDCKSTISAAPAFGRIAIASDAHVACMGAFIGGCGGILISGTGSAGYAWVNGKGHTVGGWGFEICDEGSAASLGRASISAALRSYDGLSSKTAFTDAIIARFGGVPAHVVKWVGTARPADYGALAPVTMAFAEADDVIAVELVRQCAQEIDRYVARLTHIGAPKVCLVGGMAKPILPWLSEMTKAVLAQPQYDAMDGALLLSGFPAHLLGDATTSTIATGAIIA